jgi:hypothetical protein
MDVWWRIRWCDVRWYDDWPKSGKLRQVCEIRIKKSNKVKCIVFVINKLFIF